jgi:hypothetical protein
LLRIVLMLFCGRVSRTNVPGIGSSHARLCLIALLLLVINGSFAANPSPAQQSYCDPSLAQLKDTPLGYRERGDRCEGLYIREVSSTTLLIASFTESYQEYNPSSGKPLQLEWDSVPGSRSVHLRAQGLKRRLYYRMDTVQSPGRASYVWPSSILASLSILKNDLGVVGWTRVSVGEAVRDVYIPLRISQEAKAIRSGGYKLRLLPGVELTEIFISLAPIGASGRPKTFMRDGEELGYGYYPAERGLEIPISGLKEPGIYYMEIGAKLRSGGTSTAQLWFYHPHQ